MGRRHDGDDDNDANQRRSGDTTTNNKSKTKKKGAVSDTPPPPLTSTEKDALYKKKLQSSSAAGGGGKKPKIGAFYVANDDNYDTELANTTTVLHKKKKKKGDDSTTMSIRERRRKAATAKKLFLQHDTAGENDNDSRIFKHPTADDELAGQSIWDLVDRSTIAVGCCLILVVILAITIPVVLISNDEPYIQPPEPKVPTLSPTSIRDVAREDIMERILPIIPISNEEQGGGGVGTTTTALDVLLDSTSAHSRAFNWLVYEDGLELDASSDHVHQRYVLMVIYYISGPWTPIDGKIEWGSPVHECEWEGVYCKNVEDLEVELNGRIDEMLQVGRSDGIKIDTPQKIINRLELRQRLVTGVVPSEMSLLYYLQHLDLENNQLSGALPEPLYKLFNLQTLFLESNELTNVDAIGEYRYLEHLALSKNAFVGTVPSSFSNLKQLKTLYLHTNAFTGRIMDILQEFTSLELLDLAYNSFTGSLPPELGQMTNLTSIFLGQNQFSGTGKSALPPQYHYHSELISHQFAHPSSTIYSIKLRSPSFTVPNELSECANLTQLSLDGSPLITGPIPDFLGKLSNLEFIKLDTCAFTGTLPSSLGNLDKLTFLDVNSNELTGLIPATLGKASSLKTLGLANNNFGGSIPSDLGMLTALGMSKVSFLICTLFLLFTLDSHY